MNTDSEPPEPKLRILVVHNSGIDDDGSTVDGTGSNIGRMKEAEDEIIDVANHVIDALSSRGHDVKRLTLHADVNPLIETLNKERPDVVFNLVESLGGDPAREPEVPTLLDAMFVPYTGNQPSALKNALEKDRVRHALSASRVPIAKAVVVDDEHTLPAPDALDLTYPLFVKPARVDGSIGIDQGSIVLTHDALSARVNALRATFKGAVLVEEYLPGTEINIAVVPNASDGVFAPTVLDFTGFASGLWPVVTYAAKWVEGSADYNCASVPVGDRLSPEIVDEAIEIARYALLAIGADGYARVDMRLDASGHPRVIDVNPNPALHPEAGFCLSLGHAGLNFETVVESIATHAITRELRRAHPRFEDRGSTDATDVARAD